MSHPGSAPCPPGFAPGEGGPPSVVVVEIISIKPNTDLEGDDDFVPFYDNHADIYGFVTIDGEKFNLPDIEDDDFPHWEKTGPRSGVFEKAVSTSPVKITIDIWEGDSGATFGDDHVKINSLPGKHELDFEFDLCSLLVRGDISGSSQSRLQSSGGSGNDAATILFSVYLKDGRPFTKDDLALVDVDLIQVIPKTNRLVAGKGTVVMVRIANNHSLTVNTNLSISISGGGVSVNQVFPLSIKSGEVKKQYFFRDNPIVFPPKTSAYPVTMTARVVDPGSSKLPPEDCRIRNDRISTRQTPWKVVTTRQKFTLQWAKVGSLLDVGNYAPNNQYEEIVKLGAAYIKAVYPLKDPVSITSTVDIPPPPLTTAMDWLVSILSAFGIPADAVEPFILVFELNAVAALLTSDRLMGVLPNKDWFKRFSYWKDVTGFSLGEFASRAVIFLPSFDENDTETGSQMTLPAHELGHTFGLSTDSRLKTSWVCAIDWPILGHSACGLVGGFDEYRHNDPNLKDGDPANGYWVKTGTEPPELAPLADKEQCDSHCFMGNSRVNAQDHWENRGRWIDAADYNHLVTKLAVHKDPEVIYLSGMISWHNQIYLGPCFRLGAGVPDHSRRSGMYGFRFISRKGRQLSEVALPVAWNHAEFRRAMPVTFFGVTLEFPRGATKLEIWNRGSGTCLTAIDLTLSAPEVILDPPKIHGRTAELRWTARDDEDSKLTYVVLISPDGEQWWPVAHNLDEPELVIDTKSLESRKYEVQVLALNSIRVGKSNRVTLRISRKQY